MTEDFLFEGWKQVAQHFSCAEIKDYDVWYL